MAFSWRLDAPSRRGGRQTSSNVGRFLPATGPPLPTTSSPVIHLLPSLFASSILSFLYPSFVSASSLIYTLALLHLHFVDREPLFSRFIAQTRPQLRPSLLHFDRLASLTFVEELSTSALSHCPKSTSTRSSRISAALQRPVLSISIRSVAFRPDPFNRHRGCPRSLSSGR